jgi:DNA ligase-1
MQDARFRCEPKNEGKVNATTSEEQAIKEAIAKWKKQVKKKYHWSESYVLSNINLKPMLAKDFKKHEKKLQHPVFVQPKYDGVRCLAYGKADGVVLQSRGGDLYTVQHIQHQLHGFSSDYVLDGELYCHGVSLQTINSWVRRPQKESMNVVYVLYDIFVEAQPDLPFIDRLGLLASLKMGSLCGLPNILLSQTEKASSYKEVKYYHAEYVKLGYEGVIVRSCTGQYRFGYRSSDLLKLKEFQDAEFKIVGWATGKGKFQNVPTFRMVTNDGKEFDATLKGTEAERLEALQQADSWVGKQMTVRFFDWTDDGIPHFPLAIGLREAGQ